ncbi:Hint domain-containing protein [Roseomonas terrae]|uniref:Hint domain-containing protein n=1 Tax=Neoroseomonas terrae TaxID=424799 RepID=A0ABS5ECL0_9PROT|nr:Hint domain-containing protein [Neoroseomonas terrae]MBR0648750.1 Hint domain-containing protein [Neoroseomonas terrae]
MATFESSYYTILNFDGTTYTAATDSIAGDVTSFDNEPSGGGQPGSETFEEGDNMTTSGAISGGGQYVGFYGDGYIGNQGGTYYYFSNTPISANDVVPVDPGDFDVVCFLEGTMIATPDGEVPVQTLRSGDLVLTLQHGQVRVRPLIWVGRMEVAVPRGPAGRHGTPITFLPGSLGDGMPCRGLRVSPAHGILIDNALVPAGLLVNGETILQDTVQPSVTYFHLELEKHGLLLSDGAWSESYLDDDNRHLFGNGTLAVLLHGADALVARHKDNRSCLPVLRSGPALDRIRVALSLRAQSLLAAA